MHLYQDVFIAALAGFVLGFALQLVLMIFHPEIRPLKLQYRLFTSILSGLFVGVLFGLSIYPLLSEHVISESEVKILAVSLSVGSPVSVFVLELLIATISKQRNSNNATED